MIDVIIISLFLLAVVPFTMLQSMAKQYKVNQLISKLFQFFPDVVFIMPDKLLPKQKAANNADFGMFGDIRSVIQKNGAHHWLDTGKQFQ